jgi:hypothetical protein
MEVEFDKEIDALLRQSAKGETASAATNPQFAIRNPHLDADAISSFAENALPENVKQRYTIHLADCQRCRKILSNVILSNDKTKIVSAKETTKTAVAASLPWYRKLFAYPNLAYTMGALVLAFSGLIAFVALQNNSRYSQNGEISQLAEKPLNGKGMSSDGETAPAVESFSNATSVNTTSNASSVTNSASISTANSSINTATANSNSAIAAKKTGVASNQTPKNEPRDNRFALAQNNENFQVDGAETERLTEEKQLRAREDKKATESADAIKPEPKQQAPSPKSDDQPSALARNSVTTGALNSASAKKAKSQSGETANVAGKIFKHTGGVWTDSAYKGQPTTNITRGTDAYEKLDSGLRSIAANLGATVVVIWKQKAYRIQ